MILKTLCKVEAKGNYETAHRLRARIGSVFRYAVASEIAENDSTYALGNALIQPTREHIVPLPARAVELLNGLIAMNNNGGYLFPSLRTSKRPMSENTRNAALRRMGHSGEEMNG